MVTTKKHYLFKIIGLFLFFIFLILLFHMLHAIIQPFIPNKYDWLMILSFTILTFEIIFVLNKYVIQQKIYFVSYLKIKNNWGIILFLLLYFSWMIFHVIDSNWQVTFSLMNIAKCIDAGINEEFIFRGIILMLFLKMLLNKSPHKQWIDFIGAILLSTLLFSCLHVINIFTMHQNTIATIIQITFTVSMGITNSVIYLRTKNLLIPILMHFVWDINPPSFDKFTMAIIWAIILLIITTIIMFTFIRKDKIKNIL